MVLLTVLIRINELATPQLPQSASTPSLLPNLRARGSAQRHCRVRHGFGVHLIWVNESPSCSAQNKRSAPAIGQEAGRRLWSDRSPAKSGCSSKAMGTFFTARAFLP